MIHFFAVFCKTTGSLRIDDFCTSTPLDCVTCLLRMPIWAFTGVATKSTTLVRAICRRLGNSRTSGYFSTFSLHTSDVSARYFKYHRSDMFLTYMFDFVSVVIQVTTFYNRNLKGLKSCVSFRIVESTVRNRAEIAQLESLEIYFAEQN